MKILSYNIYCIKNTEYPTPNWETRQNNIKRILNDLLKDTEIKLCCFQEVNENNIDLLTETLKSNNFNILEKFPMKTEHCNQYNLVAIRNERNFKLCILFTTRKRYRIYEYRKSNN